MKQKPLNSKLSEQKLGRGLSALFGDSSVNNSLFNNNSKSPSINNDVVEKIPLSQIQAGVYQPRTSFEKNELEELAESIKEHGVIQPIILRKIENNKYEIIAGERRFRASKIAKLNEIPAIIRKIDNQSALEIAIIENVQRSDLSATQEALGYNRLIEEFSYNQDMIAKKVGKSRSHIANLLRLLNLPVKVQEYVDNKIISMGHARAIINASNPEELAEKIIKNSLNVRQVEELVRSDKYEKATKKPAMVLTNSKIKFISPKHIADIENNLRELLKMDTKILFNPVNGNGKITFKFEDLASIQNLIKKLQN
ncbi:MAG: ParB/RepB/Spo0J family partition protein [Alphaproteobacteria bacterium]